jgi:hypothetical protein
MEWYVIGQEPTTQNKMLIEIERMPSKIELIEQLNKNHKGWQHEFYIHGGEHICNIKTLYASQWTSHHGTGATFDMAFRDACKYLGYVKDTIRKKVISDQAERIGNRFISREEQEKAKKELAYFYKLLNVENESDLLNFLGLQSSTGNEQLIVKFLKSEWDKLENAYFVAYGGRETEVKKLFEKYGITNPKKDKKTIEFSIQLLQYGKFIIENKVDTIVDFEHYFLPDWWLPFHMQGKNMLINGIDLAANRIPFCKENPKTKTLEKCEARWWLHVLASDKDDLMRQNYGKKLLEMYPSRKKGNKK